MIPTRSVSRCAIFSDLPCFIELIQVESGSRPGITSVPIAHTSLDTCWRYLLARSNVAPNGSIAPTESAIETPHRASASGAGGACRNALSLLELEAGVQPVSRHVSLYRPLACGADATVPYERPERRAYGRQ
jgi:hypothetical protein